MGFSLTALHAVCAGALTATATLAACGTNATTVPRAAVPGQGSSSSTSTMSMPASTAAPATAPVAADHVAIQGFAFGPATVTVKPGTTVTWTQQDEDQHTVTANDASFTSSPLITGVTYTHTFTAPGTYQYHCSIHPFMHGAVVVTNG